MIQLPVYFTVGELAKILCWNSDRTRRWIKREGILIVRAGRQVVSADNVRNKWPEAWARFYQQLLDRERNGEDDG